MKKIIIAILVVIVAFVGVVAAIVLPKEPIIALTEQEIVVTAVNTDIEGLNAEVLLNQDEESGMPVFEVVYTNNEEEDFRFVERKVFYEENSAWKERHKKNTTDEGNLILETIEAQNIFCMKTVDRIAKDMGEEATNTFTAQYNPWIRNRDMDVLGKYKMTIEIKGVESEEIGTVTIEWEQREKE